MADFPVPYNDRRVTYTAVGGETTFDFDFPIYENTGLEVIRTRSGSDTTLTLTTHYTVSINTDQEADPGGTITLAGAATPAVAADVYLLKGNTTVERTTDFAQRGAWNAADINEQFDRFIMMLQEFVTDETGFVLRFADTFTGTVGTIPVNIAANQYIRRNSSNTGWEAVTVIASASVAQASESAAGLAEIATQGETNAGSDDLRYVTPLKLAANLAASTTISNAAKDHIAVTITPYTGAVVAGIGVAVFRMPYAMTLTSVKASLATAQTSGTLVTVDINESGSTILSTKLTLDNGEKTSTTAATAAVISDSALAADAEITIDVDSIGDGTAKGLIVYLIGKAS